MKLFILYLNELVCGLGVITLKGDGYGCGVGLNSFSLCNGGLLMGFDAMLIMKCMLCDYGMY